MDFLAKPEITETTNSFCNAQSLHEYDTDQIMDISPFDDFFEFDWATQFPYQTNKLNNTYDFNDLENFTFDFNLPNLDENLDQINQKPINVTLPELELEPSNNNEGSGSGSSSSVSESDFVETSPKNGNGLVNIVKKENEEDPISWAFPSKTVIRKTRSSSLQFDDIKKYFDVPLTMAAKKMNVGVTLLKKRCRELKIKRWPHRKLKSLMLVIDNLKESGLENEVAMLEKQKKMMEKIPGMELNTEIKKIRQAFFKAKYKKRRSITHHP